MRNYTLITVLRGEERTQLVRDCSPRKVLGARWALGQPLGAWTSGGRPPPRSLSDRRPHCADLWALTTWSRPRPATRWSLEPGVHPGRGAQGSSPMEALDAGPCRASRAASTSHVLSQLTRPVGPHWDRLVSGVPQTLPHARSLG